MASRRRADGGPVGRTILSFVPAKFGAFLARQPFVVVASHEQPGRVWASLIAGGAGFARALADRQILLACMPAPEDPLEGALERPQARIGVLAIEFGTRQRIRQAREVPEYWIHRQQILQALDRPSDLRADLAGPVLEGLRWAYPYRLAQALAQPGDTVTITITGPVSKTWHLVAAAPGWVFRDQPAPSASLMMNTEQAWRLLTNNLPAAGQAGLTVAGDEVITSLLLRTRAIIGIPRWA